MNPLSDGKSDFYCRRNTFFSGIRFYSELLFSQVPKKCTNLDLSLIYNLTLGTCSKFARKNNFLSLCARRCTVAQRSCGLCGDSRSSLKKIRRGCRKKKIRRGCRKKQIGVLKRRVFRQCHFQIRHHELFLIRSRSDFHDGNRYD